MPITIEEVDSILAKTDWEGFYAQLEWLKRKPSCNPYDGDTLCNYWQSWISSGRSLYSDTKEGLSEYIQEIRKEEPRLRLEDITCVIQTLN